MRMKINPIPKGPDGRDNAGRNRGPGRRFEVTGQSPKGAATNDGTAPDRGPFAPDVEGDRLPPWRERSLRNRANIIAKTTPSDHFRTENRFPKTTSPATITNSSA